MNEVFNILYSLQQLIINDLTLSFNGQIIHEGVRVWVGEGEDG
jgi:hypothetical protein